MIDPTIWEDENFGKLSPRAQILFIGLFSNADDEGRIRGNALYLRSTVFMYADLSLGEVTKIRDEVLATMRHVKLYTFDDKEFLYFDNWNKYQKQREDRLQPSNLPNPSDNQMSTKCQPNVSHMSAEVKLSKVKLSKVKLSEDKCADKESAAQQLLHTFNEVFGTKYTTTDPLVPNLEYWLKSYTIGQILEAVKNAKYHHYWKDKLTPEILLRRKNPNGEMVDRIGEMLNYQSKAKKGVPDWVKNLPITS